MDKSILEYFTPLPSPVCLHLCFDLFSFDFNVLFPFKDFWDCDWLSLEILLWREQPFLKLLIAKTKVRGFIGVWKYLNNLLSILIGAVVIFGFVWVNNLWVLSNVFTFTKDWPELIWWDFLIGLKFVRDFEFLRIPPFFNAAFFLNNTLYLEIQIHHILV